MIGNIGDDHPSQLGNSWRSIPAVHMFKTLYIGFASIIVIASFPGRSGFHLPVCTLVFRREKTGNGAHDLFSAVPEVGAAVPGSRNIERLSNGQADGYPRPADQSMVDAGILGPGNCDRYDGHTCPQRKEGSSIQSLFKTTRHALTSLGSNRHEPSEAQRFKRTIQGAAIWVSAMDPDDAIHFQNTTQGGDVVQVAGSQWIDFLRAKLRENYHHVSVAKMVKNDHPWTVGGKVFKTIHGQLETGCHQKTLHQP
jgi:hypothetical protein